jgi:outer membrane protein assembly factor BamB
VYVGSHDETFYVLERDTGKLIQKLKLDGSILGSPAVAGANLLIGTEKGTLYCLGE